MATVFIPDITQLSKEEWREQRRNGIGGSDVGAILGLNKYKSMFDVYYDKIGAKNLKPVSSKTKATLEIGSRLEDFVAEMFQEKYPSIIVEDDHTMYQHDQYHFIMANIDRRLTMPDGAVAILECKTLTNDEEWESTDFCKGIKGTCPLSYEFQARQYMAVLDAELAFVVGLDLMRKELYVVIIARDREIENQMIEVEKEFWNLVESRAIPSFSQQFSRLCNAVKADAFKRFYGASKEVVYQVHQKDEIDIFNAMNDLILVQQFHSAEAQKAKEEKEELAMQLFVMCEEKFHIKPSRIELNSVAGDLSVNQYITLTDTTAVNFDLQRFVVAYNHANTIKLPEDIDEATALVMGSRNMPDRIGEFITMKDKGARFYFSKRKTQLRRKTAKKKEFAE